jgi:hypothetical protein
MVMLMGELPRDALAIAEKDGIALDPVVMLY